MNISEKDIFNEADHVFAKNIDAGDLLERFLVSAVSTIIITRIFLKLTGYPQLGRGGLHIAHMLWGGILMLAAIIILLSYITRSSRSIAAILGGVGFGLFIDEIGKIVTRDSNYFFQPAFAIMYVIFMLLYLGIRYLHLARDFTGQEYLLNALDMAKESIVHDLDPEEKEKAMQYLANAGSTDPMAKLLKRHFSKARIVPSDPDLYLRVRTSLKHIYTYARRSAWFSKALITVFLVQSMVSLFLVPFLVRRSIEEMSVSDWGYAVFTFLPALMALAGIGFLRKRRLLSYTVFKYAVLVHILITPLFAFYKDAVLAMLGLAVNLLILAALNYMILEEDVLDKTMKR